MAEGRSNRQGLILRRWAGAIALGVVMAFPFRFLKLGMPREPVPSTDVRGAPPGLVKTASVSPEPPRPVLPPTAVPVASESSRSLSPAALSASGNWQYERSQFTFTLNIAMFRAKVELTEKEMERLLDDVADFEHVRALLERPLVKVISSDETTLVLQIPAYPEQGATLKTALIEQIGRDFSPDRAAAISRTLDGREMDALFAGFGKFWKKYTISRTDDGGVHLVFSAGLPDGQGPVDAETRLELGQLTGDGSVSKGGIGIFYEALAPAITSWLPAEPVRAEATSVVETTRR